MEANELRRISVSLPYSLEVMRGRYMEFNIVTIKNLFPRFGIFQIIIRVRMVGDMMGD